MTIMDRRDWDHGLEWLVSLGTVLGAVTVAGWFFGGLLYGVFG